MSWNRPRVAALIVWTAGLACVGLFAAPLLAVPMAALALPALMLWGIKSIGLAAGVTGVAALCVSLGFSAAPWVALLPLLVLAPPVLLSGSRALAKASLPTRIAILMGCLCLCAVAALTVVWKVMGESPVLAAVSAIESWLANSGQGNPFLLNAYRYGLARMRVGPPFALQFGSVTWITPAHVRELTDSFLYTVQTVLETYLPSWIISGAAAGAALIVPVLFVDHGAAEASVPSFCGWRLTVGSGVVLLGAALDLIVLNLLSGGMFAAASAVGMAVFRAVLSIQGASVAAAMLEKRSVPNALRKVLIGICFVIFGMACFLIGIADALFDLRQIRKTDERSLNP